MRQPTETSTLRDYLEVLRERLILIVVPPVLAAAAALGYSLLQEPTYETSAAIGFQDVSEDLQAVGTPVGPDAFPEKEAAAGARLVTRSDVVLRVREALGTDLSENALREVVTTQVEPDSNLVRITARGSDPQFVTQVANQFARQTRTTLNEEERARFRRAAVQLEEEHESLDPEGRATATGQGYREGISRLLTLSTLAEAAKVVRRADFPTEPVSPEPVRDSIIAAVLGLLIGIGLALLRHSLDRRLKDSHEAQHQLGMPLVGYVRNEALGTATNGQGGLFAGDDLDAFRVLRTNFDFMAKEGRLRSVVVTSALPEEGKSTVAAWFAYANVVAGRRTLLLECDFRRPVLAQRLGLPIAPGLSELLAGEASENEVLRVVSVEGKHRPSEVFHCIVSGDNLFQPSEMLGSNPFKSFLAQIVNRFDLVVIDAAPVLPVSDTLEVLPRVDAALFCVRLDQTTREQAHNAKSIIEHLPEIPMGLVVTGVKPGEGYYGYYSYSYADRGRSSRVRAADGPD